MHKGILEAHMPAISAVRSTQTRSLSSTPTLRQGSRGVAVSQLQQKLKARGEPASGTYVAAHVTFPTRSSPSIGGAERAWSTRSDGSASHGGGVGGWASRELHTYSDAPIPRSAGAAPAIALPSRSLLTRKREKYESPKCRTFLCCFSFFLLTAEHPFNHPHENRSLRH